MKLCIFVLIALTSACCLAEQKISVKGKLFCGDSPASNIRVKLVDADTGGVCVCVCVLLLLLTRNKSQCIFIGLDDTLDSKTTNSDGTFLLSGSETEITDIDAFLKIYHKCNAPFTQVCVCVCVRQTPYADMRHKDQGAHTGQVHQFE
jgi:hypothetical protein